MRVLKNSLIFVMGMIVGIILFVVAIGGAAYVIATSMTVGELEDQLGITIIDKESEIGGKSLYEVVTMLLDDIQNIDTLTVRDLITRYGLPIPETVSGVDITVMFDYPLLKIPDNLSVLVNSVTLEEIGKLANVDFGSYGIPVLNDNLDKNVQTALDALLSSINSETMTLRAIEDKFGLTLGSNEILDTMKDAPLSSFGGLMNALTVGDLVNIDLDVFLKDGENEVWVNVDRYEKVAAADYAEIKEGAERYIQGADDTGKVIYKELRYVQKKTKDPNGNEIMKYVVDNASNAAGFAPTEEPVDYYRHIVRERYSPSATYKPGTVFCSPAYVNEITISGSAAEVKTNGFINLTDIFTAENGTETANDLVNGATFTPPDKLYYATEGVTGRSAAEKYGLNPEILATEKSKLEEGYYGYLKVKAGAAATMQTLSGISLSNIDSAMDKIMELKLGEILTIDESSPAILISMKDKTLGSLQNTVDDISLGDIVAVKTSAFIPDAEGEYVFVNSPEKERYVLYDAAKHSGMQRYEISGYTPNANGKYVKYNEKYYLYDARDSRFDAALRCDRNYAPSADGIYVKTNSVGYYTLYNPDLHDGYERYSVYTPAAGGDAFVLASEAQKAANTELYYYDTASKTMTPVGADTPAQKLYYVKGVADSKALQRLANVSVGGFAENFNNLILGDVLEIGVDTYKLVATGFDNMALFTEGKDYFTFDGELYLPADVFDSEFRAANPDAKIYAKSKSGAGNAVLKKLALVGVNDLGVKMNAIVDSLYLSDIIDIPVSAFIEDATGNYVYYPRGGYYTLYDAGNAEHKTLKRYSKLNVADGKEYVFASGAQLADDTVAKYYYDASDGSLKIFDGTQGSPLFVEGKAASKVLQRFAKVSVGNFSSAFGELVLGEVLDVDTDVYVQTQDTAPVRNKDYYTYSNGVYSLFEGDTFTATERYYEVERYGEGHVILKKLAFVKIDEMGARMPAVIESVYLSELIDIYSEYAVREFSAGDDEAGAKYLVGARPEYTLGGADDAKRYTFVYDTDGKYYKSAVKYEKIADEELVIDSSKSVKYNYTQLNVSTLEGYAALTALAVTNPTPENKSVLYLYYKNSQGEYIYDTALTSYLLSQKRFGELYYKKPAADGASSAIAYKTGATAAPLYVVLQGVYVPYEPEIPTHEELDKFFKLSDGYVKINASNPDFTDAEKKYFDFSTGAYVAAKSADTGSAVFAKLPEAADGKYYFIEIDNNYNSADDKYSKKECERIFVEDANGSYVYKNGSYKSDTTTSGVTRFREETGYLASASENGAGDKALSALKMTVINEKSVPVLRAFGKNKVTVANLGEKMRFFTLGDLIEIEPDSMFDDPALRNATMSNVSSVITAKLFDMSFADLIKWGNITGVDPRIVEMLSDVKMADFVKGLSIDATGRIYLDIEKVYGLK